MSTFASDFMDKFDARWDEVDVLIKMAEQIGTEDALVNFCRKSLFSHKTLSDHAKKRI